MENHGLLDLLKHSYSPPGVQIANYIANESSTTFLVSSFFSACALLLGLTFLAVNRLHPRMPSFDKVTLIWFVLSEFRCGPIRWKSKLNKCLSQLVQFILYLKVSIVMMLLGLKGIY